MSSSAITADERVLDVAFSDDALSVLVPILETIAGWNSPRIREFFEGQGFVLREWDKVRTDSLTICRVVDDAAAAAVEAA